VESKEVKVEPVIVDSVDIVHDRHTAAEDSLTHDRPTLTSLVSSRSCSVMSSPDPSLPPFYSMKCY
jgi:hypothetical protein